MSKFTPHPHQSEALTAIRAMDTSSGRIVMPTGSGKTAVEAWVLEEILNQRVGTLQDRARRLRAGKSPSNHKPRLHLVLAPRILLANQLMGEFDQHVAANFRAIGFHSGTIDTGMTPQEQDRARRHAENQLQRKSYEQISTTSVQVLKEHIARGFASDQDVIIVGTYHSCNKLAGLNFDTIICDESQYCIEKNFYKAVGELTARRKLFFTATEKHTDIREGKAVGRGLNNEEVFGPVVYQVAPQRLIEEGFIVKPRLHVMGASSASNDDNKVDLIKQVIEILKVQVEFAKHMPEAKIIIAMKGGEQVDIIAQNAQLIQDAIPDFDIYTILSDARKGARINGGEKVSRNEWLKEVKSTPRAFIFHYDILSEGYDLPGVTGVVILRNMYAAKAIQTMGRAMRTYSIPGLKSEALVSTVLIDGDNESSNQLATLISGLRDGDFDINIEKIKFTEDKQTSGTKKVKENKNVDGTDEDTTPRSKQELINIFHNIEINGKLETLEAIGKDTLEASLEAFFAS